MELTLDQEERAVLAGESGAARSTAMRLLVAYARAIGAGRLLPISSAHVDGCLYHGEAGLDFVELLYRQGGRVRVPTTLNVGSIDLIHPDLMRLPPDAQNKPRRLMQIHEELGCIPSFTCAPYQTMFRPRFGDQIAWGESNAIVFANSVIGARTNRYADFIDLCCAMTGRVPAWGLHLDENRRGQMLFRLVGFSDGEDPSDALFNGVGLAVGARTNDLVPVIEGLPPPRDEDQLKALGAAAASTGAVGLFHAVGITPEATTVAQAFDGQAPVVEVTLTPADVRRALGSLSTVPNDTPIAAVCLGTPHFSRPEWDRLVELLRAIAPDAGVPIYVNTGRATLDALREDGTLDELARYHVIPVADTCTYVTAILRKLDGAAMTNSAKWAHYAPGNIGCEVAFGELEDCIVSAALGRVTRGRYAA